MHSSMGLEGNGMRAIATASLLVGLVVGGPPTVTVVLPAGNWAGFKPPEKPIPQMLTEVYGEAEAAELFETFARSWRSASSSTWQARPDLSLLPSQ